MRIQAVLIVTWCIYRSVIIADSAVAMWDILDQPVKLPPVDLVSFIQIQHRFGSPLMILCAIRIFGG